MRIRNFRFEDIPALTQLQQAAIQVDSLKTIDEDDFEDWLSNPEIDALANVFIITDDDDEVNTWGQAGTLEGIEGEIIGYTLVQLRQEPQSYHLFCQGTVQPQHRGRHAGRALLICALNRARFLASEFEFEAEQARAPIYFEAFLPERDAGSQRLAAKCDMAVTSQEAPQGLRCYRREL